MTDRRGELAANLADVQADIAAHCRNRPPATLIVVTKTWPASDVRLLASLGVTDVGENRDQEARTKHSECADVALTWHCIGQLQTNKAKSVALWADVVHSVDRLDLVTALERATVQRDIPLAALIQVNLDPEYREGRGGCPADQLPRLAERIAATAGLRLAGVMGVAPLDGDPAPAFQRLAQSAAWLRGEYPQADWISAGMSADYRIALEFGATHLRLGSSVLGHRPAAG